MGPIVSIVTLHGWKTQSRKTDQSVNPDNATVNG